MKIYRFKSAQQGVVRAVEVNGAFFRLEGSLTAPKAGEPIDVSGLELDVPVEPTKIICVGLNYKAHAAEQGKQVPEEPLIFMKPLSALNPSGSPIRLPAQSQLIHHEAELAFVIGKRAEHVMEADAMDHVLGFTCANDVSARDIQRREKRYTRAKGFNTFCCVGPCVVTPDEFDYTQASVQGRVNDELRQDGPFSDFIFDLPRVISFISDIMTLEPGDLILTGTPSGVGPIEDGDTVTVTIDGIGTLTNPVTR